MKKHLLMLAIASTCFVGVQASAADMMSKADYKVAKEKIDGDYKVAKAACDAMKGNAKDVCKEDAKGKMNVAKAELEQQNSPSPAHERKVAEEKATWTYNVSKEKCDDQSGNAKSACVHDAKATQDKAKADIKAMSSSKPMATTPAS